MIYCTRPIKRTDRQLSLVFDPDSDQDKPRRKRRGPRLSNGEFDARWIYSFVAPTLAEFNRLVAEDSAEGVADA